MKQLIIVDGVERELVRVVVKPTPGNPEGKPRITYRDQMAPGEQTVEDAEDAAAQGGTVIAAEVGERPDDSHPGEQIDAQGLDPIPAKPARGRHRNH